MKSLLLFVFVFTFFGAILSNAAFGSWHSWDTPPKNQQLYMQVHVIPGSPVEERQTLFISPWNGKPMFKNEGWWEVTPDDLWKWFHEGNKLAYIPNGLQSLHYFNMVRRFPQ